MYFIDSMDIFIGPNLSDNSSSIPLFRWLRVRKLFFFLGPTWERIRNTRRGVRKLYSVNGRRRGLLTYIRSARDLSHG